MSTDPGKLLTTFALMSAIHEQANRPRGAALELTNDGWQVWDGESYKPVPVHCDLAWEIAEKDKPGSGDIVMEKTRQLCLDLRIAAKRRGVGASKRREIETTLKDLRDGMARVRATKATSPRKELS